MTTNQAVFNKDTANNKISVVRSFNAPLDQVWKAWTDSSILDQWWAPQPYRAETKTLDFRPGGNWLYCMVGPDNYRMWCRETFRTIDPPHSITSFVCFCDENGVETNTMPHMHWKKEFVGKGETTEVHVELSFDNAEDMQKIIDTGFEQGFTAGLENLDHYLAKS